MTEPGIPQPELSPVAPVGPGTTVLERELDTTPRTQDSDGDHDRFAHYVRKEKILESALSGDAVIALCGKVWVPGRDPNRYPVCPTCKEIFSGLPPGGDGDDDRVPDPRGAAQSTLVPYISPSGSASSSRRAPSGSRK